MRATSAREDLVPLNPEIEAICRKNDVARRIEQQEVQTNQGERGPSPSPFHVINAHPKVNLR